MADSSVDEIYQKYITLRLDSETLEPVETKRGWVMAQRGGGKSNKFIARYLHRSYVLGMYTCKSTFSIAEMGMSLKELLNAIVDIRAVYDRHNIPHPPVMGMDKLTKTEMGLFFPIAVRDQGRSQRYFKESSPDVPQRSTLLKRLKKDQIIEYMRRCDIQVPVSGKGTSRGRVTKKTLIDRIEAKGCDLDPSVVQDFEKESVNIKLDKSKKCKDYKKDELRKLAKQEGKRGYGNMNKAELCKLLGIKDKKPKKKGAKSSKKKK